MTKDARKMLLRFETARNCDIQCPRLGRAQHLLRTLYPLAQNRSARTGIYRNTIRRVMESLGWTWTPTMQIGSGCKVHLRDGELPAGRLIVSVSRHTVAVLDGVIHDIYDPSRDGTRCVYGYYSKDKN
jgi:hypothetical protein